MQNLRCLTLVIITLLVFSCSSSEEGSAGAEPGKEMPDNEFTYKEIAYTITGAELTPQPDPSAQGDEVFVLVLWGGSADGRQELRFDLVVNSAGPGLVPGSYPFQLYSTEPDRVKWGSVVVYMDEKPFLDDAELAGGELIVYRTEETWVFVFEGTTVSGTTVLGKFKGRLG